MFCLLTEISTCPDFEPGDGGGVSEKKVSTSLTGGDCVDACREEMKKDSSINGVSVYKDGRGGCWCEQNLASLSKSTDDTTTYKTCFLNSGKL